MDRRAYSFLLISLCVHFFLIVAFSNFSRRAPKPNEVPISVEVLPFTPGRQRVGQPGTGLAGRPDKLSQLSLSDLGIGWKSRLPADTPTDIPENFVSNALEQSRSVVSDQYIYDRIDEALYYPEELKVAEVEGTVKARLVFGGEGQYIRKLSSIRSGSPYLRVFVVRLLQGALREPLPLAYRPKAGRLAVEAVFFFDISRRDNPFDGGSKAMVGHAKNRAYGRNFAFYRSARVVGEWSLGPLKGYGVLPAVTVDPAWFIDRAAEFTGERQKLDRLQRYREDPEWGAES